MRRTLAALLSCVKQLWLAPELARRWKPHFELLEDRLVPSSIWEGGAPVDNFWSSSQSYLDQPVRTADIAILSSSGIHADSQHGGTPRAQRGSPQTFYLDFDGAQNVTYDGPVRLEGLTVPAFTSATFGMAGLETSIISSILDRLNESFAGSGVTFTTVRPDDGQEFSTIFVGGSGSAFARYGSFWGLAEQVDHGNRNPSDTAFVFSETIGLSLGLGPTDSALYAHALSSVIAHEAGHLLGRDHASDDWPDSGLLSHVALMSAQPTPLGPEIRVSQTGVFNSNPAVAIAADGDFVVVWTSDSKVYARRYNASGNSFGPEFLVSEAGYGPNVAMNEDGDFVIVWASGQKVHARRYNVSASAVGPEFVVMDGLRAFGSTVAIDARGNFVVTWGRWETWSDWGVYARRYDALGHPLGTDFRVSTTRNEWEPEVAMDADGGFVITWTADTWAGLSFGSKHEVYARRYDASGTPLGTEFRVGTSSSMWTSSRSSLDVAMSADGDFVITWENDDELSDSWPGGGVRARRYDVAGNPLGPEFHVHGGYHPTVAVDAEGSFVVVWQNGWGWAGGQLYGQRFALSGSPLGPPFHIGPGDSPEVAMNAGGDFVVAWDRHDSDDEALWQSANVYARRYSTNAVSSVETVGPAITIITHGRLDDGFPQPWLAEMASAILGRHRDVDAEAVVVRAESPDLGFPDEGASRIQVGPGHYVLILDWSKQSTTWGSANRDEVAGSFARQVAEFVTRTGMVVDLHFIGHSRGAYVNAEIIRRLGEDEEYASVREKIDFLQMTTLDPQPQLLGFDGFLRSNPGGLVKFADNYFQRHDNPEGHPIDGALNIDLTRILDQWNGRPDPWRPWKSRNHEEVHDWYHWTIDTRATEGLGDVPYGDRSLLYDSKRARMACGAIVDWDPRDGESDEWALGARTGYYYATIARELAARLGQDVLHCRSPLDTATSTPSIAASRSPSTPLRGGLEVLVGAFAGEIRMDLVMLPVQRAAPGVMILPTSSVDQGRSLLAPPTTLFGGTGDLRAIDQRPADEQASIRRTVAEVLGTELGRVIDLPTAGSRWLDQFRDDLTRRISEGILGQRSTDAITEEILIRYPEIDPGWLRRLIEQVRSVLQELGVAAGIFPLAPGLDQAFAGSDGDRAAGLVYPGLHEIAASIAKQWPQPAPEIPVGRFAEEELAAAIASVIPAGAALSRAFRVRDRKTRTVKELRLEAKRRGLPGYWRMRKSELLSLLGESPVPVPEPTVRQLRQDARALGVRGFSRMPKHCLLEAIAAARSQKLA